MYQLEHPDYFFLLSIIPAMVLVFLLVQFWRKKKQKNFAEPKLMQRLSPDRSIFKGRLKLLLLCLTVALLSLGLVNPKIGTKLETIKREGIDIVFAIDVSKSMLAEDIAPNRLEKAKRLVSEIVNQLASDRIGIVAYAGQAFPLLPITTDYAAGKMFLQSINTNIVSSQGTAIAEAIRLAATYYDDDAQTKRVLFIISDGEDHDSKAVETAEKIAKQSDITIFTIGVGTPKGNPIPIKRNGVTQSYKRDKDQEVVITRLNENILKEIAKQSGGKYINGNNTQKVVDFVKETLQKIDKTEFESTKFADYKDQFQWFVGLAALLLFLDVFILDRKTAWIKKLNLFNEKKTT